MSVTIYSKDIGEVKNKKCYSEVLWQLEDGIEKWIKNDLEVRE